ncbi:MAG: hypothetical protein IPO05_02320 [Flavobacteriales bacterium]|nr:hypothetical protein [Flavobacteriales bacterium]
MVQTHTGKGPATRLAPTPSGFLHAGNAISFLLTHFLASRIGATMVLRIDDLDQERTRPAFVEDIFEGLHWLGIDWQRGPTCASDHFLNFSQSLRLARYNAVVEDLIRHQAVFACTCSRPQTRPMGTGSICIRGCEANELEGVRLSASLRLRVPPACMVRIPTWRGEDRVVDLHAAMGEPVIRQRPGPSVLGRPSYQIASLADDIDMGITHIVRGVDLLPSTACQLHIAGMLGMGGFLGIRFVHHELILDPQGGKLSKSAGSASLKAVRERNEGPEALFLEAERLSASVL